MRKSTIITVTLILMTLCFGNNTLARPKISLVLGGGAARGISHIGLLKAFEEEGIPIDYVVGTSMGSVIAGLYAAGLSADNLEYLTTHVNLDELFVPMVPPRGGFLSTERFEKFIDSLTDEAHFETVPIPFSTVAINLISGKEVTIREGKLSQGIVASMAIPAVFPPTRIGDDYFVDGGMRSLVPVEVAKQDNPDLIIAVDVRNKLDTIDHDTVLSNVQLAAMVVLSTDTSRQLELADIVIQPDVGFESYMDYDRAHFFIEQGYVAAKEAIPRIRSALLDLDPNFPFGIFRSSGYAEEDFALRLRESLDDSQNNSTTNGTGATRLSLELDSEGHWTTQFGITVPTGKVADKVPTFGSYSSQKRGSHRIRTFGFGLGSCDRTCVGIFGRKETGDPKWGAGVSIKGETPGNWHYEGEWEQSATITGWSVSANGPIWPDNPKSMSELHLVVGQDARGLYRRLAENAGGTLLYKYYYTFNRTAFWEAVNTSSHAYVGIGTQTWLDDNQVEWQPIGELGMAFEARLFGLYPIRSSLAVTYAGPENPWTLRLSLGEW